MFKKGFTLAEVMIALGIVGIVAVIASPLLSGIVPDKNKVRVLKIHKTVSQINVELLGDPGLYLNRGGEDYEQCEGFECREQPLASPFNMPKYSGSNKYKTLLMEHLNATGTSTEFTTPDGAKWTFTGEFSFTVDVDSKGKDCVGSSSCKKPDQFKFIVEPTNGNVEGGDLLTIQYLDNPHKLNDRDNDYRKAGIIR